MAVLLAGIIAADRARNDRRAAVVRVLSLALVTVLVAEAAGVTVRLVVDLVEGGPETNSATDLLSVGFGVWLYTILAFAFLYWVLDGGGPDARLWAPPEFPNLAFPEQLNPVCAAPGWRPQFFDYLYLGFTNATAFSPTDVMPLARWAKAAEVLDVIARDPRALTECHRDLDPEVVIALQQRGIIRRHPRGDYLELTDDAQFSLAPEMPRLSQSEH